MKNGQFRIIDADGHVMEPAGMWARYICRVLERPPAQRAAFLESG
jgi:hypothetical protein